MNITRLRQLTTKLNSYQAKALDSGASSIIDWYFKSLQAFDKAGTREGICAKVTIVIKQDLILTREGFEAQLTIGNEEEAPLTNINITLLIKSANDSTLLVTHLFSIGNATLDKISGGIRGNGRVESGDEGTIKWIIIPYKEAAPESTPVNYLVSGSLVYYSTSTSELVSYDLYPRVITVRPDPTLELYYFLEKFVQSDDPLTPEKEPTIPFTLGLLLSNRGGGVAYNLSINSFQPEIVDNEKGLLIDFKIISSNVNGESQTPPSILKVNMGDVRSNETKQSIWLLTSSLKGRFIKLNATYTNVNPNGDPKLSLIDKLVFKQLFKSVLIDLPIKHDSLVDFFVLEEFALYPNKVYLSQDPSNPLKVNFIEETNLEILKYQNENLIDFRINYQNASFANAWFYTYLKVTENLLNKNISRVSRSDGRVLPLENCWTFKLDKVYWLINVFDYVDSSSNLKMLNYSLQFGDAVVGSTTLATLATTQSK